MDYSYSGNGKRIAVNTDGVVVKYIYDGLVPIIERDVSDNTLVVYTKAPTAPGGIGGLISSYDNQATLYYHCSHLGNVNQITNSRGRVVQSYSYDAFGNIVSQSGSLENEYTYKTKEYSHDTGFSLFTISIS